MNNELCAMRCHLVKLKLPSTRRSDKYPPRATLGACLGGHGGGGAALAVRLKRAGVWRTHTETRRRYERKGTKGEENYLY